MPRNLSSPGFSLVQTLDKNYHTDQRKLHSILGWNQAGPKTFRFLFRPKNRWPGVLPLVKILESPSISSKWLGRPSEFLVNHQNDTIVHFAVTISFGNNRLILSLKITKICASSLDFILFNISNSCLQVDSNIRRRM